MHYCLRKKYTMVHLQCIMVHSQCTLKSTCSYGNHGKIYNNMIMLIALDAMVNKFNMYILTPYW